MIPTQKPQPEPGEGGLGSPGLGLSPGSGGNPIKTGGEKGFPHQDTGMEFKPLSKAHRESCVEPLQINLPPSSVLSGKCGRDCAGLDSSRCIYGALAPGIQPVGIFARLHHLGIAQPQQTHLNPSCFYQGRDPAYSLRSKRQTLGQINLRWISINFMELQLQFGPCLTRKSAHFSSKSSKYRSIC